MGALNPSRRRRNSAPAKSLWRFKWIAAAVVSVAIGSAVFAVLVNQSGPATLAAVPITSDPELEYSPSLSPDANHVVYVRARGAIGNVREPSDIFVRQIGEEREVALTSDGLPKGHPVWSPD